MNTQSSNSTVVIDDARYEPGVCWAHFSDRQAHLSDVRTFQLSFATDVIRDTECSIEEYMSHLSKSDQWLNVVLRQSPSEATQLLWVFVSVTDVQREGSQVVVSGKCRRFDKPIE